MKSRLLTTAAALVAATLSLASCETSVETLKPVECGGVERIHALGGVFLASQPQPGDFTDIKKRGIKTIVTLRKAGELEWDEADVVRELGLEFHSVPFREPEELTDEVFDRVRDLLNQPANKPLFLHCGSANRVGAVWIVHRVLDHDMSFEDAHAEAKTVGLKTVAYVDRAREYIAKSREA